MSKVRTGLTGVLMMALLTAPVQAGAQPLEGQATYTMGQLHVGDNVYDISDVGRGSEFKQLTSGTKVWVKGAIVTKPPPRSSRIAGYEYWTTSVRISDFCLLVEGEVLVDRDDKKVTAVKIGGHAIKVDPAARKLAEKAEGQRVSARLDWESGKPRKSKKSRNEKQDEKPPVTLSLRDYEVLKTVEEAPEK